MTEQVFRGKPAEEVPEGHLYIKFCGDEKKHLLPGEVRVTFRCAFIGAKMEQSMCNECFMNHGGCPLELPLWGLEGGGDTR